MVLVVISQVSPDNFLASYLRVLFLRYHYRKEITLNSPVYGNFLSNLHWILSKLHGTAWDVGLIIKD